MTISYKKLFAPLKLVIAGAKIFTVDVAPTTNLLLNGRVRAANNTGSAATVTLNAVPVGGTADDTNVLVKGYSVPPNGWLDTDLPEMAAGDFLQGYAGTDNAITLHYMDGVVHS